MDCPDCGSTGTPHAETFEVSDALGSDHPSVTLARQQSAQLECPDCGAVLGYLGVAAAVGEEDG